MRFEFAYLWVFYLLPLPLLFYWLLPPLKQRRSALVVPFFERINVLLGEKPRKAAWVSRRNLMGWISLSLIWLLLLGAMASPQLVGKPEQKIKTARNFMVAADISKSMDERDWIVGGKRVSRWEAVKEVMGDFMETRESDKVGLILFGSNAYLQAPLTADLGTIKWLLNESEVGMAGQMTYIGDAIAYGLNILKKDSLEQKVMLLLTDGSDSGQGITPEDAAQLAKEDSVTIYTLGIGDPNQKGQELDEPTLKRVAEITGGQYFRAMDEHQLKQVYTILNELEPVEYEEEAYKPVTLLYKYPLAAAIGVALCFLLLRVLTRLLFHKES
ncbi:VWA domain-containing protein [Limibacter armeniacum]|uniref:VWA domain-containing protein n=1 Tax=Limibacter armeniacum TaxID=466084 RepID=UPI002FE5FDB1